ncbi:MAG TPA: PAS domain-containing protein, partial [Flavitalea sp.]|nr:PAS domain-containing protein [Flavitalea sp.]
MVNKAACKLFGYSKKELLTKTRASLFDITEPAFKKMLKQRTAEGNSTAQVTAIKKNKEMVPCEITSAIFTDADGVKKAITTIADMRERILEQKKIDAKKEKIVVANIHLAKSKQKRIDQRNEKKVAEDIVLALAESEARLEENNEWIKYIAKTSYDVMWDWDIASGEIYVGDSLEEVFGYKVRANKIRFSDFINCLLPEEQEGFENKISGILASGSKSWDDAYQFMYQNGSVASTTSRASIVRDDDGKAIRMIGAIQDISRLHELENQITTQEKLTEKFSLAAKVSIDVIWDWNLVTNELYIGDQFEELFGYKIENKNRTIPITEWGNYLHPDDKEAVESRLHDVIASTSTRWEQVYRFMKADNSIAQVFNRASIFRQADGKAYRLIGTMQDLSRVNELQEKIDSELQNRLPVPQPFADIVKKLGLCGAINAISRETIESNAIKISGNWESFSEINIPEKFKLNIYRIIKEHLTNIIKHARATEVTISLEENTKSISLHISDNGIGFDTNKPRRGTGIVNINSLTALHKGKAEWVSQPEDGCE